MRSDQVCPALPTSPHYPASTQLIQGSQVPSPQGLGRVSCCAVWVGWVKRLCRWGPWGNERLLGALIVLSKTAKEDSFRDQVMVEVGEAGV